MLHLERASRFLEQHRRLVAMLLYAGFTAVAYVMAYVLRFEFAVPPELTASIAWTLVCLVAVRLVVFRLFRLTRERWRYAGAREAGRLLAACVTGSALFLLLVDLSYPGSRLVPLSVVGIEGLLTCGLISSAWLGYRLSFEHIRRAGMPRERRVLMIGAGDAGNLLAREMRRTPTGLVPVGFVDDNPRMWGALVQGLEVVGCTADIGEIARDLRADELIIALPSAGPDAMTRIVRFCEQTGLPFKVLPGIAEVVAGNVSLTQLREVQLEDLLGREPIQLELPELAADLAGETVLITGAAGSIGSELARQVALHRPAQLVLLDQAETDLFYLEIELRQQHPSLHIVPVVGDITDPTTVERVFRQHPPQRVFHAAAYKHVPMMESNAVEAVRNNVIGTWIVADAAGRHGAGKFVLVSTDKAVRPSNIMGASKRLAELVILEMQQRYVRTAFGAVRFGNVLGSNGSVIPLFRRQLRDGQPLTVTHPDATRYFMTIPEAVQLILQASLLGDFRGHIAMLEMGAPVRIRDLAFNLLKLSGMSEPEKHIVYIGLRPGEKLHEELAAPDEEMRSTTVPKVRLLRTPRVAGIAILQQVAAWEAALRVGRDDVAMMSLASLFPALAAAILANGHPPSAADAEQPDPERIDVLLGA